MRVGVAGTALVSLYSALSRGIAGRRFTNCHYYYNTDVTNSLRWSAAESVSNTLARSGKIFSVKFRISTDTGQYGHERS